MDFRARSKNIRPSLASRRRIRSFLGSIVGTFAVTAYGCATTTHTPVETSEPVAQTVITGPTEPVVLTTDKGFSLVPFAYSQMPNWLDTDFVSARSAFLESCGRWEKRSLDALISKSAPYSGTVGEWLPSCEQIRSATSKEDIVKVFEDNFTPFSVEPEENTSKLTGYFEPELEVRYSPEPGFTKSVPGIPADLIRAEPAKFDKKFSRGKVWGRVVSGELELYPDREFIVDAPEKALAYANAGEVFYLQIQGSGRLKFPDGRVLRAAFAAHNHKPFVSIARHLIDTGKIERHQAGMKSILNWLDTVGPDAAQTAMNVNPRYVWFAPQELTDPSKGPNGAQGVPLTPMSSMAVDPRYHPYGTPIFIDTKVPITPGDWKGAEYQNLVIAQDTGGAIKGILRGDLFFGWGDEAGGRAASMNHNLKMWVLLPKTVANNMTEAQIAAIDEDG